MRIIQDTILRSDTDKSCIPTIQGSDNNGAARQLINNDNVYSIKVPCGWLPFAWFDREDTLRDERLITFLPTIVPAENAFKRHNNGLDLDLKTYVVA